MRNVQLPSSVSDGRMTKTSVENSMCRLEHLTSFFHQSPGHLRSSNHLPISAAGASADSATPPTVRQRSVNSEKKYILFTLKH